MRFERRGVAVFESIALSVSRPEDTSLMKLRWRATLAVTAALARVRAEARPIE